MRNETLRELRRVLDAGWVKGGEFYGHMGRRRQDYHPGNEYKCSRDGDVGTAAYAGIARGL